MTKLHVFDIDGTIIEGTPIATSIGKKFNIDFPYENVTKYSIAETLLDNKIITDLTEFDNDSFFKEFETEIFKEVSLIKGFKEYLTYLEECNKDILFLTARYPEVTDITVNFFEENGLNQYIDRLIMGKSSEGEKLNYIEKNFTQKVTMYEDKNDTIIDFYNNGHNVVHVLQPYNKDINFDTDNYFRIRDYYDLLKTVVEVN